MQERIQLCNPYVKDYMSLMQIPKEQVQEFQFVIDAERRPGEHGARTPRTVSVTVEQLRNPADHVTPSQHQMHQIDHIP